MKDINVLNKISSFFSNERVDLILNALKGKKLAKDFLNAIGQSSNLDIQSKFICMCLQFFMLWFV